MSGKVALITGAAHGMGRSHAILLAQEGANVVVTDRDRKAGASVAEEIASGGGSASFAPLDVSSEIEWKTAVSHAVQTYGSVDVLVNNAGTYTYAMTENIAVADWDRVFAVNARGTFLGCREVIPVMKRAGGGSIVNVASNFGLVGRPGFAAYCASKGAVRMMTKAMAAELASFNIRVNSLHPGLVATDMTRDFIATPQALDDLLGPALIRRAAEPMELARAVLFLASEESSYVTGSEFVVDGGYSSV
jgi:cyclopentanol dehydrogenase